MFVGFRGPEVLGGPTVLLVEKVRRKELNELALGEDLVYEGRGRLVLNRG